MSELGYQHQNHTERRIQDVKRIATKLSSLYRAPGRNWDFSVEYTTELIHHTAVQCLDWRTPYKLLHGETPDISVFRFIFYELIYYFDSKIRFPQANMLLPWCFLGIAQIAGDTFTFIIISWCWRNLLASDPNGIWTWGISYKLRRQWTERNDHLCQGWILSKHRHKYNILPLWHRPQM